MSKTKYSKFNDSGNMLPFYGVSVAVAVDQISKVYFVTHFNGRSFIVCQIL